jgi:hypothetical protein
VGVSSGVDPASFPRITDAGLVLVSATAVLTARVVYEQTLVTWMRGEPWVGVAESHSIVDLIGMLCVLLAAVWALLVVILAAFNQLRFSAAEWTLMAVLVVCCGLWTVPSDSWQLLMARSHDTGQAPKKWVVSAAAKGDILLLGYLLTHGVDVNTRAQYGESPLGAAAAGGQMEAARMLIARGARLDNRTAITLETPLTEAARMNHTDMVKLLLDHGANSGEMDVLHRTALDWAHENGNPQMANLLQARPKK